MSAGSLDPYSLFRDEPENDSALNKAVEALIESLTVPQLRKLAKHNGWKLSGLKREVIEGQVRSCFESPDAIAAALLRLDPQARLTLDLMAWLSPISSRHVLDRLLALAKMAGGTYAGMDRDAFSQAIARLSERGMVLTEGYGELTLTQITRQQLGPCAALLPPVSANALQADPSLDPFTLLLRAMARIGAQAGLDLDWPWPEGALWQEPGLAPDLAWPSLEPRTRGRSAAILPAGSWLEPEGRDGLDKALGLGRPGGAEFFTGLLLNLSLFQPDPLDDERLLLTETGLQGLSATGTESLTVALVQAWLQLPYGIWDLISQAERSGQLQARRRVDYYAQPPETYNAWLSAQRWSAFTSLDLLPAAAEESWVDYDRFLSAIGKSWPEMMIPSPLRTPFGLVPAGQTEPLEPSDPSAWPDLGVPLLGRMLDGPMRWLGLVELARDAEGRPQAIRRTRLAEVLLGRPVPPAPDVEPPSWDTEIWRCHLQASLPQADLLAGLSILGEVENPPGDRLAIHLSQPSILAALESDQPIEAALAVIEAAGAMPPGLVERIDEWSQGWGRINLVPQATLIELDDPSLAREVLAGSNLRQRILFRVSPTAWLIDDEALPEILADLERAGYRPRVLDRQPEMKGGTG